MSTEIEPEIIQIAQLLTSLIEKRVNAIAVKREAERAPEPPPEDKWLTAKEVSRIIGKTENSVYRDARAGKIPSKKFGGSRKFLLSQVMAL